MAFRSFQRPVFNAIAAYSASAFVVLQAADLFLPALLFPDWVFRFLVVLALIGLPLTALLVWLQSEKGQDAVAVPIEVAPRKQMGRAAKRIALAAVLVLSVAGGSLAFVTVKPEDIPFEQRDWLVIADCDSEPREPAVEEALTNAMEFALRESHHASVFPRNRIAEALQRMERKPSDPFTREVAIELAQREGIAGVVTCTIAKSGDGYMVNAAVVNPQTSTVAWSQSSVAPEQQELLGTIESVAREMRAALGESRTALWREARSLAYVTTSSLDALKSYTEANKAWTDGKYQEAATLYESAVQRDSLFARAHAALGYWHYWSGRREPGELHLNKARQLSERVTDRERLWLAAYIEGARSNREAAVTAYQTYLRAYDDDRDGWYNLGTQLMFLNRCNEAIPAFERALKIDSLQVSAIINTGTCHARDKKYELGLPYLLRAQKLRPEFFNVGNLNHELGSDYLALGQPAKAREIFELRLKEKLSEQAGARRSLGLLEAYQGHYQAGVREMREAIRLARASNSTLGEVRNRLYLAAMLKRLGNTAEARQELTRVGEIGKTFAGLEPWWLQITGRLHAALGDDAKAQEYLTKAKKLADPSNQDDATALQLLEGEILLEAGKTTEAIDLLEPAYARREDGFTRDPLARANLAARNLDRAVQLFQTSVDRPERLWEAQESWFDAHLQLARIAEVRGDTASALKHYTRLLELWKEADAQFPDLQQAQARVRALAPGRDIGRQ